MNKKSKKQASSLENKAVVDVGKPENFNRLGEKHSEVKIANNAVDGDLVTWDASEYIDHQKSAGWYIVFTVTSFIFGTVFYLLVHDIFSLVVLLVMYIAILIYANRKPRVLRYGISEEGVSIGDKHFTFDQFHSFSVVRELGIPSIILVPTQRFMPAVSIYFAPEDSEKIIEELSKFLPNELGGLHLVDKMMLKLRF